MVRESTCRDTRFPAQQDTMNESAIFLAGSPEIYQVQTKSKGPAGDLPIDEDMLLNQPSGNLFGLTQNAGMGLDPRLLGKPEFLILSTSGGLRADDGKPLALAGLWERWKEPSSAIRRCRPSPSSPGRRTSL